MLRVITCAETDPRSELRARGIQTDDAVRDTVAAIIADVRTRGDAALLDAARRFDAPALELVKVSEDEITAASVEPHELDAIRLARQRIAGFHADQAVTFFRGLEGYPGTAIARVIDAGEWPPAIVATWTMTEARSGLDRLGQRVRSLSRAGVYVPGGNAAYPSSVLMNAIPALVAGVQSVAITTPARRDGTLHPAVLVAMREIGATEAYKVGGAAAIAALALGTETIGRVDKIVGPGNRYVNEAKRQLWGTVGLDGYAGPSEVCVLADDSANPAFAAADFITQIEHAPDNAGFLVCTTGAAMQHILAEIERQIADAPRRETILSAMRDESLGIIVRDLNEAAEIINLIAPEHLTLAIASPEALHDQITNAGCILLGEHSPESGGDYIFGPSHTLPTATAARFGSPVNVLDFIKVQSLTRATESQLETLIPAIETLGTLEGFPAHAAGGTIRLPG